MTEKEFDQQIWRRYDSVVLDNGLTAIISNVAFTTRSVRIYVKDFPAEWYKFDRIVSHCSRKGKDPSDDASIIEELHNKVLNQQKLVESLEKKNQALVNRLNTNHTEAIREIITSLSIQLAEKQKRAECIDGCLSRIEKVLDNLEKDEV